MIEVKVVVVNEALRHVDEGYIAGDAAVVEPIRRWRGNSVVLPRVIDRNHDEVLSGVQLLRGFAVEAGKAALVIADMLPVDPDQGLVVCRANMQERSVVGLGLKVEVSLVPDQAFVVEKLGALRIPVSGHLQRGRLCKIVFDQVIASRFGGAIQVKSILAQFMVEGIEPGRIWIDDVVPVAVEAHALSDDPHRPKRLTLIGRTKTFDR